MEEEHDIQQVEDTQPEEVQESPKKKRVVSPEQKKKMMENLEKAREKRAMNRANLAKYPKEKRERTKELYEADIEKKAEIKAQKLAEELLRKKEQEKELEEYRKWKESQGKDNEETLVDEKPTKKKVAKTETPKKSVSAKPATKSSKSSTPRKKATRTQEQPEQTDGYQSNSIEYYDSQASFNIDDFLD